MGRKHPRFSYSEVSDPSDVLLRQEPEEEEDEEEEDDDKDDNDDNDEENDGYSARPCLVREGFNATLATPRKGVANKVSPPAA